MENFETFAADLRWVECDGDEKKRKAEGEPKDYNKMYAKYKRKFGVHEVVDDRPTFHSSGEMLRIVNHLIAYKIKYNRAGAWDYEDVVRVFERLMQYQELNPFYQGLYGGYPQYTQLPRDQIFAPFLPEKVDPLVVSASSPFKGDEDRTWLDAEVRRLPDMGVGGDDLQHLRERVLDRIDARESAGSALNDELNRRAERAKRIETERKRIVDLRLGRPTPNNWARFYMHRLQELKAMLRDEWAAYTAAHPTWAEYDRVMLRSLRGDVEEAGAAFHRALHTKLDYRMLLFVEYVMGLSELAKREIKTRMDEDHTLLLEGSGAESNRNDYDGFMTFWRSGLDESSRAFPLVYWSAVKNWIDEPHDGDDDRARLRKLIIDYIDERRATGNDPETVDLYLYRVKRSRKPFSVLP